MRFCVLADIHLDSVWKQVLNYFEKNNLSFDFIVLNGDYFGEFEIPKKNRSDEFMKNFKHHKVLRRVAPKTFREVRKIIEEGEIKIIDLSDLILKYIFERQDRILSYFKKLKNHGFIFFNFGNHESPFQVHTRVVEFSFLSGIEQDLCNQAFELADQDVVFERFLAGVSEIEAEGGFKAIMTKTIHSNEISITGIPGYWFEYDDSEPGYFQESLTYDFLNNLGKRERILLFYHMQAPPILSFKDYMGSPSLAEFMFKASRFNNDVIIINSHMHFSYASYFQCKKLHYLITTAGLNDGVVTIIDLKKSSIKISELNTNTGSEVILKPLLVKSLKNKPKRSAVLKASYGSKLKKTEKEREVIEDSY